MSLPTPVLDLDFTVSTSGITFTRASNAMYCDSSGVFQQAAVDTARIHHDSSTLDVLGLYIERTNYNFVQHGSTFQSAMAVNSGLTGLDNQPTAYGLKADPNPGGTNIIRYGTYLNSFTSGYANSGPFTVSAYVRRTDGDPDRAHLDGCFLTNGDDATGGYGISTFSLAGNTIGVTQYASIFTETIADIHHVRDEWYRIYTTVTNPSGVNFSKWVEFGFHDNINDISAIHPWGELPGVLALSTSCLIWSWQTDHTLYPTSPMVPDLYGGREKDLATSTDADLIGSQFIVVKGRVPRGPPLTGQVQTIYSVDDGSAANRYEIIRDDASHVRYRTWSSGVMGANVDLGLFAPDSDIEVAIKAASGDLRVCINGGTVLTDSSTFPSITTARFGTEFTQTQYWDSTIKSVTAYTSLTNDQMREATGYTPTPTTGGIPVICIIS